MIRMLLLLAVVAVGYVAIGLAGFPYRLSAISPCSMAAIDPEGFYGFDIYWSLWPDLLSEPGVISNDPSVAKENRGFPYMSYAKPRWADPYDYCKSLMGLG